MDFPLIAANNISVSFYGHQVFQNVSLNISRGESFVLIGTSGQGKTTLLKTLAGLIKPQQGEVTIESINIATASGAQHEKMLSKIGMLFQKNALFDSLTCGENIAFPLRETTRLSENEISERVDFYLDSVGIPHAKFLYPDEISGGMQKRLGIARALAREPEILFYDDPTAGLDPITSRKIIDLILEMKRKNKSTLVAITNDMNRAYQLSDRIGLLVDRELVITGNKQQTLSHADQRVQQFIHGHLDGPMAVVE